MRKFVLTLSVIFLCASTCFAWGFKKEPVQTDVDNTGKGYVGKLPDISKNFTTSESHSTKPIHEKSKEFNSASEIKPIPRDNPAFVNIILKNEQTSPYLNDVGDVLPQLENILLCIENEYDVQKFNAKVYFLNKTVEYLTEKYYGKPESSYISFKKLQELNSHTKSVATLRAEAEKYKPYLAYTGAGYLYNENVINQQLEYLKTEIETTIAVLKEAN